MEGGFLLGAAVGVKIIRQTPGRLPVKPKKKLGMASVREALWVLPVRQQLLYIERITTGKRYLVRDFSPAKGTMLLFSPDLNHEFPSQYTEQVEANYRPVWED